MTYKTESFETVLNGSGAPSGGTGEDGDFYIDTDASDLYGPKSGGVWGSPTSLIGATGATGATGAAGADGKTVLNGSGAPSPGEGVDGDFYIDTAASDLYGPKAGSWPTATSLIGPTGATGATGDAGATGTRGSLWFEGTTDPYVTPPIAPPGGFLDGDLYLRDTGEVFTYNYGFWSPGSVDLSKTGYSPVFYPLNIALRGVLPSPFVFAGAHDEILSAQSGDYTGPAISARGQHIMLNVITLAGTDTVTVTGTSMVELNGVPTVGDTEIFMLDATGKYQTAKKWVQLDSITFGTGITAISYTTDVLGYFDNGNHDFIVQGYRMEIIPIGPNRSLTFRFNKVKDLGANKVQIIPLEDWTWDATGFTDNLRSGGSNRSHTGGLVDLLGHTMKLLDFATEFPTEHQIMAASADEGMFFEVIHEHIDYIHLLIHLQKPNG
jgi:hypothetical protein